MNKRRVGIVGATGYTGSELVRILTNHPGVEIAAITSESRAGELFSDVHPFFRGIADYELVTADKISDCNLDLVFLALPHGVSMDFVKKYNNKPFKIIDLSGDFRLESPKIYEEWYKKEHIFPEGITLAVFGLPEIYFNEIKKAKLVANPGCYPTCSILGIAPLISKGLIETSPIIIDSKSGVTGTGVKAKPVNHFSTVNDNFKAYGLKYHRHTIEIQGILDGLSDNKTSVQFTPHLLPVDRGILSTTYTRPNRMIGNKSLSDIYREFYKKAPFIRICEQAPAIKDVRGTNYCDIYVTYDARTDLIITISVIDNLVKGAAGQAVQNMNIMFGLEETVGLYQAPVNP
ncbi:MAG: N-acetyl-gamma-glutamyl-phosphate reductase [candidate division Zixibacteria bacterium]|nr:N-acetyl-gamma-glutamyl-phosphate reductase [candidate division Zixibacteria bacterium]